MKKYLSSMMIGCMSVMSSMGLGLKFNDGRFYIVVAVLFFCHYILTYDNTRSDKGN